MQMPDLISREVVFESQGSHKAARREFSYLIVSHRGNQSVTLEEYREGLQANASGTGDPLHPRPVPADAFSSSLDDLRRASQPARPWSAAPGAGFATLGCSFTPRNARSQHSAVSASRRSTIARPWLWHSDKANGGEMARAT